MTQAFDIPAQDARTQAQGRARGAPGSRAIGLFAAASWLAASASAVLWPDLGDWTETGLYAVIVSLAGAALLILALVGPLWRAGHRWLTASGPWLVVIGLFLTLWQLAAAKLGWLPQPFFPPPQALIEVIVYEYADLWVNFLASARLLIVGFAIGAAVGFVTGVAVGWSTHVAYWVHPLLRFIGPLPATALLPVVFVAFPSSWSASIFLIALASFFPVAILTWSGVAAVNRSYYDVARTLGVGHAGLITKVAIPAALPSIFVGLFMALGAAFSALMVAELVGVKAGVAFYIQWNQGWAAYANVWVTILILAALCSGAISLLFRLRDRTLSWQKGLVKW